MGHLAKFKIHCRTWTFIHTYAAALAIVIINSYSAAIINMYGCFGAIIITVTATETLSAV
jgi:hypothetical protein